MTYTTLQDDLHKILLWECKISSRIGSLWYMKYIEKKTTQYQPLKPFLGDNDRSQNFEMGSEKNDCLGKLRVHSTDICLGPYCVSCQKTGK